MKNKPPEKWWVIATEPNGSISYLKNECKSFMDAVTVKAKLEKEEPRLRYQLIQIY